MKNKDTIIKIVAVASVLIIAVAIIAKCSSGKTGDKYAVGAESVIASADELIYYNNTDNNVICKNTYSGDAYVFLENMTILDADMGGVLATDGIDLVAYDTKGNVIESVANVNTTLAQITSNYIYYKQADSGHIEKMDRETKLIEEALPIEVRDFIIHGDKIVFTVEKNDMIFTYDMETGMSMGYFGDKSIGDFTMYGADIIYSDLKKGGNVYKFNLTTGEEAEISGVQSSCFEYNTGSLYYIENVKDNSKNYKLKNADL